MHGGTTDEKRRAEPRSEAAGVRARLDEPLRRPTSRPTRSRTRRCGGPYRTHWQRHHVVENHMDAHCVRDKHPLPMADYTSLDTAAMQFRPLRFRPDVPADPAMPDDARRPRLSSHHVRLSRRTPRRSTPATRRHGTTHSTSTPSRFPSTSANSCSRRCRTSTAGPGTLKGPQVLRWDAGKHVDDGGRPTIECSRTCTRSPSTTRSTRRAPGSASASRCRPTFHRPQPPAAARPADRQQAPTPARRDR